MHDKRIDEIFCNICKIGKVAAGRFDKERNRICYKCYRKHFRIRNKLNQKKWNDLLGPRVLKSNGRKVLLSFNPRKGKCQLCYRTIKNHEIKITNMHHIEYFIIFPWFATVELCASCHAHVSGLGSKTGRLTKKEKES